MKQNRSFARRIGKSLSRTQTDLLENVLSQFKIAPNEPLKGVMQNKIILEIGFGMGEHFINQAQLAQDSFFIGSEVYLNGVANVLKLAQEVDINNFALHADDIDLLIEGLPDAVLSEIYILFPDPWPKKRHIKRRLINEGRLKLFSNKLKSGGCLFFATDIDDYGKQVLDLINANPDFICKDTDHSLPHHGYIKTKFHQKALDAGRVPQFYEFIKRL